MNEPEKKTRARAPVLAGTVLLGTVLAVALALPGAAAAQDPKAAEIAAQTLEAMGGQAALDATRFIRFNFFGFRTHHWDRYTGRHRVEGKNREGDAYVLLHNVNTREGEVYLNGERQDGETKKEWLERAYGMWVNDTYWLLMPYKLRDPGVTLAYDGEETLDGVTYDKLELTFDNVGLTPGDTYWAYINRSTGLMDRWAYVLESFEEGQEATQWLWQDWQTYGGIKLAGKRTSLDPERPGERPMGDIAVFDELPDAVFTSAETP